MAFSILTVCTGNICRSPYAELLLRDQLRAIPEIEVSSAGTSALRGHPMDVVAAQLSSERGVRGADKHVAQPLNPELIESADLVLGLSRRHRRRIVEMVPRSSRICFTLNEFSRCAAAQFYHGLRSEDEDIEVQLRRAVSVLAASRGMYPANKPDEDDIADPFQQPREVYVRATEQIERSVASTTRFLVAIAGR